MKCFYHDDLDGQAAGFCVYTWAGISEPYGSCDVMHPINYGQPFPFDIIEPDEQVWIVDYSIKPDEMRRLLRITPRVTWIDHHKDAIDQYDDFEEEIAGVRIDGEAGCVLAWKYLHWWSARGQAPFDLARDRSDIYAVPRMIELVGDRDVWVWKHGDETKHFFLGSQIHDTSPCSEFWHRCMDHEVEDLPLPNTGNRAARIRGEAFWEKLLEDGATIEKFIDKDDEKLNNLLGFECEFEGHNCWCVNRPLISSDRCGDRINRYDAIIGFSYDEKQWKVELRSSKVDVSEVARKHGGNGHVPAAGFRCDSLPFIRKEDRALLLERISELDKQVRVYARELECMGYTELLPE